MRKKLFVGNLSTETSEQELRAAFEGFGTLDDVEVARGRDTRRSRGFGFVTFADADACAAAQRQMDGATLSGQVITVHEAREKPAARRGR